MNIQLNELVINDRELLMFFLGFMNMNLYFFFNFRNKCTYSLFCYFNFKDHMIAAQDCWRGIWSCI